jgi:hypothetical protein
MKNILTYTLITGVFFLIGCDPNKELYESLDDIKQPYNKTIRYTLTEADYNSVGGVVSNLQAFTEEIPAMDYVPAMLSRKFLALNLGSSAMVDFNFQVAEPVWLRSGFGYEMTENDYTSAGVVDAFSASVQAKDNLPSFLLKKFRDVIPGNRKNIIYNYREGNTVVKNLDIYEYNSFRWNWIETRHDLPYIGRELLADDYHVFGGSIAANRGFSSNDPADEYMSVWLKNAYPYAIKGDEQVIKYKIVLTGTTNDIIAHYTFDGILWEKSSDIIPKSEQYVFGAQGWAFDPTTRFIMSQSDYMYLAVVDPLPHAVFTDFGYYYGASAFYSNFDMRLAARRVSKNSDGNYFDTELGAIFDSEGPEATVNEMYRRLVEEGFIILLQHKYPQAVPQSGGIDVHYIVGFETFNDNFSRSYLESEYRCTAAASGDNPPQFELIEGPRERQ